MWKKSHSGSSKKWRYGIIFEWKRLIFLHPECDFFFVCLIDFYRPFKSGTHTRFLSTQNPAESAISSDLSTKQRIDFTHLGFFAAFFSNFDVDILASHIYWGFFAALFSNFDVDCPFSVNLLRFLKNWLLGGSPRSHFLKSIIKLTGNGA